MLAYFGTTGKEAPLCAMRCLSKMVYSRAGGLILSLGRWSQVLSLGRKAMKVASDDRVLGSGDFVQNLISEVAKREKEALRLSNKVP